MTLAEIAVAAVLVGLAVVVFAVTGRRHRHRHSFLARHEADHRHEQLEREADQSAPIAWRGR